MAIYRSSIFNISFIFFSLIILVLLTISFNLTPHLPAVNHLRKESLVKVAIKIPKWYEYISKDFKEKKTIKIGLVNTNKSVTNFRHELIKSVTIQFDRVQNDLQWKDLFPHWIDESGSFGQQNCPKIPLPGPDDYRDLDVVLAEVPCGNAMKGEGVRDVARLQVNLVVANLIVWNGWKDFDQVDRTVYVVFVGACGPMWEIFRCDDLVFDGGDGLVYKPDLIRLKQKVVMPVGSCRIAPPITESGWLEHIYFT